MEFFNIPESFSFSDVVTIHNHSYVSPDGQLRSLAQGTKISSADYGISPVCRERPYFVCYYDDYRNNAQAL